MFDRQAIRDLSPGIEPGPARALTVLALVLAVAVGLSVWRPLPSAPPRFQDARWVEVVLPQQGARLIPLPKSAPGQFQNINIPDLTDGVPIRVVYHPQTGNFNIRHISGPAALALGQKLDINHASARDLALTPGIGPKTAARIVRDREERGPFPSLSDLTRVKGIGDKRLAEWADWLR